MEKSYHFPVALLSSSLFYKVLWHFLTILNLFNLLMKIQKKNKKLLIGFKVNFLLICTNLEALKINSSWNSSRRRTWKESQGFWDPRRELTKKALMTEQFEITFVRNCSRCEENCYRFLCIQPRHVFRPDLFRKRSLKLNF